MGAFTPILAVHRYRNDEFTGNTFVVSPSAGSRQACRIMNRRPFDELRANGESAHQTNSDVPLAFPPQR